MTVLAKFNAEGLSVPRPTNRIALLSRRRAGMLEEYTSRLRGISGGAEDLAKLLNAVDECNGFPGNANLRVVTAPALDPATLALPRDGMRPKLEGDLSGHLDVLYRDFQSELNQRCRAFRIGQIIRHPNRVCEFVWFMQARKVSSLGREGDYLKFERVTELIGFYHLLDEMSEHPFPAANVSKPKRVQKMLSFVKPWFSHLVTIVDGKMVKEVVVAKETGRETFSEHNPLPTIKPDPAVVFGGKYVLTGWNPSEK